MGAVARPGTLREGTERFDLVNRANIALESLILAAEDYCRRWHVPLVVTPFVHLVRMATGGC